MPANESSQWENPYTRDLPCSTLAINRQRRPVDGARGIRSQKQNHFSYRRWLNPLSEIAVGNSGAILWRINRARHDAIDVDVRRLQLAGQRFRQAQHGALRCAVSGVSGAARQTVAAGDVYDCAATLAEHLRNDGAATKQRRPHVDVEKKIPICEVGFMHRLSATIAAHGVHERIHTAEFAERLLDELAERRGV